jgi:hypothetical protein
VWRGWQGRGEGMAQHALCLRRSIKGVMGFDQGTRKNSRSAPQRGCWPAQEKKGWSEQSTSCLWCMNVA